MYHITTERPEDAAAIENLLDGVFGCNRHAKISYRYRKGVAPLAHLRLVARADGKLIGSLRFWPVALGGRDQGGDDEPTLLLGPLAVAAKWQGRGVGSALMYHGLDMATWARHRVVLLVGDIGYYARFGFRAASSYGIVMPGENVNRVLARALVPGALDRVLGNVTPWRSVRQRGRVRRAIAA